MGQRLNLEIVKGEKKLANAYYHWSGYTRSALELTGTALDAYFTVLEEFDNDVVRAVKMLESTGATLLPEELEFGLNYIENFNSYEFNTLEPDRNRGLISISEKSMEETERWQEARVTIDILNRTIDFGEMFFSYTAIELEEMSEDDELFSENLPVLDGYCLESIDFGDFNIFEEKLEYLDLGYFKHGDEILGFIQ